MRSFLQAFIDHEIVVHSVVTFRPRNVANATFGTLLSVGDTVIKLRTELGDMVIALDHIVDFMPRDPTRLPKAIESAGVKEPPTKTIVLEWWDDAQRMMKERRPEAEVRLALGRVIHGAAKVLAKRGEDSELAVAKERAEVILKKCSDPTLPPDEG